MLRAGGTEGNGNRAAVGGVAPLDQRGLKAILTTKGQEPIVSPLK